MNIKEHQYLIWTALKGGSSSSSVYRLRFPYLWGLTEVHEFMQQVPVFPAALLEINATPELLNEGVR